MWVRKTWSLKNTISKLFWISFWTPKITPQFTLLWGHPFLEKRDPCHSSLKIRWGRLLDLLPSCFWVSFLAFPPNGHLFMPAWNGLFYWICSPEENHSPLFVDEKSKFKPATLNPFFPPACLHWFEHWENSVVFSDLCSSLFKGQNVMSLYSLNVLISQHVISFLCVSHRNN